MKKKFATLPKKYRITKKNPAVWRIVGLTYHGFLFDRFRYPLWIKRPICWIRTIWYTLERFTKTGEVIPYVSGHWFREQKDGSLKCDVCGNISK